MTKFFFPHWKFYAFSLWLWDKPTNRMFEWTAERGSDGNILISTIRTTGECRKRETKFVGLFFTAAGGCAWKTKFRGDFLG